MTERALSSLLLPIRAASGQAADALRPMVDYMTTGYWRDTGEGPRRWDVAPGGTLSVSIGGLTAPAQRLALKALSAWTQVTGIRFDATASAHRAQIVIDDNDEGAWSMHDGLRGGFATHAVVNVSRAWLSQPGTGFASYPYQTFIHEIGHALGLGHPGDYNGSASYAYDARFTADSWQRTVMSYFSQPENDDIDASYAFVVTPMVADIMAMQDLYGRGSVQAGATVWGVGASMGGAMATACSMMVKGYDITMTIADSSGTDLLDLSNDTTAQRIRLEAVRISSCYGLTGNLSIAEGTVIENLICGSGNDRVYGNLADNRIEGGAGADWLMGGEGRDTLIGGTGSDRLDGQGGADRLTGGSGDDLYQVGQGDVVVESAGSGTDRVTASCDWRLGDNVETLVLTGRAVRADGNGLANDIVGTAGDNRLGGAGGDDTLRAGDGSDTLAGGSGADLLIGGDGDDRYIIDRADRVIEAAAGGYDTMSGALSFALAGGVECGVLTGRADLTLRGNALANRLIGNDGDDTLWGGGGFDRMHGGAGADRFIFVSGQGGSIDDFQDDVDTIRIARQHGAQSVSEVLAAAREDARGVTLHIGDERIAVLHTHIGDLADDLLIA